MIVLPSGANDAPFLRCKHELRAKLGSQHGETTMAVTLTVLLCLFLTLSASGQVSMQPKLLTPSSTRSVQTPPFTSWGTGCDKQGNMYFHVGAFGKAEFLKLSADGSQSRILKGSDQFPEASKFGFADFSVTPAGELYVLGGTVGEVMLVRFDEHGDISKPVVLQLPVVCRKLIPVSILASDERKFLFFGYYDQAASPDLRGTSYMALLDSSGAVGREVHLSVPGLDIAKLAAGAELSPSAALGDDGDSYFAGSNQILVISPDGDLLRRISFDNPYPRSRVSRLEVSGGLIILHLSSGERFQPVHIRYLVLLPSGGVAGYYEPSEQLGGWESCCYTPAQGLIFLKVENKKLKLLTVPLP